MGGGGLVYQRTEWGLWKEIHLLLTQGLLLWKRADEECDRLAVLWMLWIATRKNLSSVENTLCTNVLGPHFSVRVHQSRREKEWSPTSTQQAFCFLCPNPTRAWCISQSCSEVVLLCCWQAWLFLVIDTVISEPGPGIISFQMWKMCAKSIEKSLKGKVTCFKDRMKEKRNESGWR